MKLPLEYPEVYITNWGIFQMDPYVMDHMFKKKLIPQLREDYTVPKILHFNKWWDARRKLLDYKTQKNTLYGPYRKRKFTK